MRRTARLSALAVTLAVPVVVAPAAAATTTTVALPVTAFRDLLVDDDHVYVTDGGSAGVLVRDHDGGAVATVADQPGASGLALSPDGGTLYVALSTGDAISAVDTTTLAETARYATGASTCPRNVAAAGTAVWFGYGCSGGGGIGVVDLSGETPAVTLGVTPPGYLYSAPPHLEARDAAGTTRLLAAAPGFSPSELHSFTASGTTLTAVASTEVGSNLQDLSVTPAGTHVVTASGYPYHHPRFLTADLSGAGTYGAALPYPRAVATTDAHVATGTNAQAGAPDVRVYTAGGALLRDYDAGTGQTVEQRGLAFAPDGRTVYAVTTGSFSGTRYLHVLRDVTKAPAAITLTKPASARIRVAHTVTGRLTSAVPVAGGQTVRLIRVSSYGTVALPAVTTAADGTFSFSDTVRRRGSYTYHATWDGDAEHAAAAGQTTLKVLGLTPSLTIATDASTYRWGATGTATAKLGTTFSSRTVQLSATPYGYSKRVLKTGTVDANGYLKAATTLTRRTTFAAYFAGDDVYEPRLVTRVVTVGALVRQRLSGHYTTSGSYQVFRDWVHPVIDVEVSPNRRGTCMAFTAQHYSAGAWRTIAHADCLVLDAESRQSAVLTGTHAVGVNYRMRGTFAGDVSNARTTGAWLYLRFTK